MRELGVLPWERQETKDGVALRGCGHVQFQSVQVMGIKPKERLKQQPKAEPCFINSKIHLNFYAPDVLMK